MQLAEIRQQLPTHHPLNPPLPASSGNRKSQLNGSLNRLTLNRIPPCLAAPLIPPAAAKWRDMEIGERTRCDYLLIEICIPKCQLSSEEPMEGTRNRVTGGFNCKRSSSSSSALATNRTIERNVSLSCRSLLKLSFYPLDYYRHPTSSVLVTWQRDINRKGRQVQANNNSVQMWPKLRSGDCT